MAILDPNVGFNVSKIHCSSNLGGGWNAATMVAGMLLQWWLERCYNGVGWNTATMVVARMLLKCWRL
ncbi:MAG: hypothetical protein ACK53Y_07615 [bacterium]